MLVTLTESDACTLRDFLRDHLQDLKFEVARTEVKSLRHDREVQELPDRTICQAV